MWLFSYFWFLEYKHSVLLPAQGWWVIFFHRLPDFFGVLHKTLAHTGVLIALCHVAFVYVCKSITLTFSFDSSEEGCGCAWSLGALFVYVVCLRQSPIRNKSWLRDVPPTYLSLQDLGDCHCGYLFYLTGRWLGPWLISNWAAASSWWFPVLCWSFVSKSLGSVC